MKEEWRDVEEHKGVCAVADGAACKEQLHHVPEVHGRFAGVAGRKGIEE